MTKEQFKEFVFSTIRDNRYSHDEAVARIADQWESDVNDARISGQNEYDADNGRESIGQ